MARTVMMLSLGLVLAAVTTAELLPQDCSAEDAGDSLSLLQRQAQALGATKPFGLSLFETATAEANVEAGDMEVFEQGSFLSKPRRVEVSFYSDSDCTQQEGADVQASAEADYCALDWNFTCACELNNKVILATHYDNCTSKTIISESKMPVGLCVPGGDIASSANLYLLAQDMGSCPCCGAECTVYGDPHITVFDKADIALLKSKDAKATKNNEFMAGDHWLVRSEQVSIQARYRKVSYKGLKHPKHTFLTGVAVGGPFLQGHVLLIGPGEGKVQWVSDDGDAESILEAPGSFKVDELVQAHHRTHGRLVKDPAVETDSFFAFQLPLGVKLHVNRFKKHLDLQISMSADAGGPKGIDGQCGNFNGDATDDTAQLIEERMGGEIPEKDLLFIEVVEDANATLENTTEADTETETQVVTEAEGEDEKTSFAQTESKDAVAASPTASALFFKDSACQNEDKSGKVAFSVDSEHCELGWNFTCACSEDSKAIYATLMTPGCINGTIDGVQKIPSGECLDGSRFGGYFQVQNAPYFMINAESCPSCCDGEVCTIHGDPHITVFDQGKVTLLLENAATGPPRDPLEREHENIFGWGDFWLVKSDLVSIQARYRKVYYEGAKQPLNHTYLTAIAVGGPFLRGHKLIIEPRNGEVSWKDDDGEISTILEAAGANFSLDMPDVVAQCHNRTALVPHAYGGKTLGVDVIFPSAVKLRVDRFGKHLDARINMPRASGGPGSFDGQCGNFNGDATDDTSDLLNERMGHQVPDDELLFETKAEDELAQ